MNERPATFRCTWCGKTKALARTGRPPRFCSDACRRAPASARRALENARYHLEAARWRVRHYEAALARHAELQAQEPLF